MAVIIAVRIVKLFDPLVLLQVCKVRNDGIASENQGSLRKNIIAQYYVTTISEAI